MRSTSVIALILVAAAGVTIGLLLQPPRTPQSTAAPMPTAAAPHNAGKASDTDSSDTDSGDIDITDLHQRLQQEILARQSLEKKVATLSDELARLTNRKSSSGAATDDSASEAHATTDTADSDASAGETWFNQQALLDAGMGSAEAERLKAFFEDMELQRLYLRDQAVREGWIGSKRFRDELQQLNTREADLRQQLSEEAFDAYLYASGQPNRVVVQSVLASAPAASAGIQAGDHVLRYDNQRIYGWRELREATAEGNINETVAIEVERDGRRMQLFVPRGPLGIRMTSSSEAP